MLFNSFKVLVIHLLNTSLLSPHESFICGPYQVHLQSKVGEGGTGIVFEGRIVGRESQPYAMKISKSESSLHKIVKECQLLQVLEQNKVTNIEKCVSPCSSTNPEPLGILLDPFFHPSSRSSLIVSDITSIDDSAVQVKASVTLLTTVLQIIQSGYTVSDLQPLIDNQTGSLLLIDLTEYDKIDLDKLSYLDTQRIRSMLSEAYSMIPPFILSAVQIEVKTLIARWNYQEKLSVSLQFIIQEYLDNL
jgi:hypothetical protein